MKTETTFTNDKNTLEFTIGFHNETKQTGWFEYSDIKTGGNNIYEEGGLWFDGLKLEDYDGVYELRVEILNKLKEMGFDVTEHLVTIYYNDVYVSFNKDEPSEIYVNCPYVNKPIDEAREYAEIMINNGDWEAYCIPELGDNVIFHED